MERTLDGLHDDGADRDALLTRVSAFVAPVASNAGAVVNDPADLDLADAVYTAFGDLDADGGLTRAQPALAHMREFSSELARYSPKLAAISAVLALLRRVTEARRSGVSRESQLRHLAAWFTGWKATPPRTRCSPARSTCARPVTSARPTPTRS